MKNLLFYFGFIALFAACSGNTSTSTEEMSEAVQAEQEIQEAETAVNTLDSMNTEILESAAQLDHLLDALK